MTCLQAVSSPRHGVGALTSKESGTTSRSGAGNHTATLQNGRSSDVKTTEELSRAFQALWCKKNSMSHHDHEEQGLMKESATAPVVSTVKAPTGSLPGTHRKASTRTIATATTASCSTSSAEDSIPSFQRQRSQASLAAAKKRVESTGRQLKALKRKGDGDEDELITSAHARRLRLEALERHFVAVLRDESENMEACQDRFDDEKVALAPSYSPPLSRASSWDASSVSALSSDASDTTITGVKTALYPFVVQEAEDMESLKTATTVSASDLSQIFGSVKEPDMPWVEREQLLDISFSDKAGGNADSKQRDELTYVLETLCLSYRAPEEKGTHCDSLATSASLDTTASF